MNLPAEYFPDWRSPDYYFAPDDFRKFPDAWCYVVWSRRGPGKTYSLLRWAYENHITIVYMRRTNKDVQLICDSKFDLDLSPYVPVCRDSGAVIKPVLIADGIGGFYDTFTDDGKVCGKPFSYCVSLNALKGVKGIDLSAADILVLDEFIPSPGEIVKHAEGEQLLGIYETVQRDRMKRGRGPLTMVLFGNTDSVATPVTETLEIIDDMVELSASGKDHLYLEDRGIMLHNITEEEIPVKQEELVGIRKAMSGTSWGRKAFSGEFASNDFTNVRKVPLKGFRPVCSYIYKRKDFFVYVNDRGQFYLTRSRTQRVPVYDLDRQNDQKRFYYEQVIGIKEALMDNRVSCELYSIYDLIVNYKKIFTL